ncbi:hypothetical protein CDAR_15391 [Caerostris darwini]|uniref:Uncharacterized protein n=1 Tax=Caerostris darwini TaxID=1538125 RepID=A0AAV4S6S5_9ARAC|nr:hypothetical protein CDAR_15391 [Caerostris darwini]
MLAEVNKRTMLAEVNKIKTCLGEASSTTHQTSDRRELDSKTGMPRNAISMPGMNIHEPPGRKFFSLALILLESEVTKTTWGAP